MESNASKISSKESLYKYLARKFERGTPDYMTVIAYNSNNQQVDVLLNHKTGDQGLDLLKTELDFVAQERPDITSIKVSVYGSTKIPTNKPRLVYIVDMSKPILVQQEIIEQHDDKFIERPYSADIEQGLSGLGGLNGYLEKVHSVTAENKILEYEKKVLKEENEKLKKELDDLDKENDKLNDVNNDLIDAVERLKKFEPNGHTIAGINTVGLMGAVAENAITGIFKKNPQLGKGLMGEDNYNAFLNGTNSIQQTAQTTNTPATEVEFEANEDESNLSPDQQKMLQYAKGVYMWLKKLKAENMQKFAFIIDFIKNDMVKADEIIDFINSKNN